MSRRLVTSLRVLAQDCETIAGAARKALREIDTAQLLGTPVNDAAVEKAIRKLERRLVMAARRVGAAGR